MNPNSKKIRTRFAPSPTGQLHLGNIRSALYPWAFARHHKGKFILRIDNTDYKRSNQINIDIILESMSWLGIDIDEGPFYQKDRIFRYQEVIKHMLSTGQAYFCYTTIEELEKIRKLQKIQNQKPRYNRIWRPEKGKILPKKPDGLQPVIRFCNPIDGYVEWHDEVKGLVKISNNELDDLVIARHDGTPTYNFCVVVDDIDMEITHVIRGEDHINNTPRQINIFKALKAKLPIYAHIPTVFDEFGKKMSKRNNNSMSIIDYRNAGYLPEAIINYLARLGWSHGNNEIFSCEQFVKWFNFKHLGKSAAKYDNKKLKWINRYYIKQSDNLRLVSLIENIFHADGLDNFNQPPLLSVIKIFKERVSTLYELANNIKFFYTLPKNIDNDKINKYINEVVKLAIVAFIDSLKKIKWEQRIIAETMGTITESYGLQLSQLAMPVRLLVTGTTDTPSICKILSLLSRETVILRLNNVLLD